MILHLFNSDKFTKSYYEFIESNKEEFSEKHQFFIGTKAKGYPLPSGKNVVSVSKIGFVSAYYWLIIALLKSDKIFLHSIWKDKLLLLFIFFPHLVNKTCWVIWGHDLYKGQLENKSLRKNVFELIRRYVIKRIRVITTTVPGDFELAKKWYGTKAFFVQNLMYVSHLARIQQFRKIGNELIIQVGNSADPSNRHEEIFDVLERSKIPSDTKIYVPLSYGSQEYAEKIMHVGKKKFGNRFYGLSSFMSTENYNKYLMNIDIAIFYHDRQQGMGNIIGLLSLGKKVYIRGNISSWDYFVGLGLKIYDFNQGISFDEIPLIDADRNIHICRMVFSHENLKSKWRFLFENDFNKFS